MDRFCQFAVIAADQAVEDSGLNNNEDINPDRIGVIWGAGIGGIGVFEEEVDVKTSYGIDELSLITKVNEKNNDLILDIDYDQFNTNDLIDKTEINKIEYNQDFELSLDDNLRIQKDTLIIPDNIEKNKNQQAF